MFRIDSSGTAVALPVPAAPGATSGYFTKGDAGLGVPATVVSDDWCNAVQESLCYVIEQAGIALSKTDTTLLKQAIEKMSGQGVFASKAFVDSPYTAVITSPQVKFDTSGGNVIVNLPAAATCSGRRFTFVKTTGDVNTITLDASGAETINGNLTETITTQYSLLEIVSTGTEWIIV